ncbi:plasmid partitioning protein RepB (plasmid) [Rhizobium favelukesii]|uniref:Plasmid partitioning protein RepB n=2 Tax=Rhizobium/Agrobacterium group TaxID=227290 RepID=W6S5N4_9HYPH|nr:plasmid partitioning protein RepB [Rhizobium favelukesii]
MGPDMSRRDRLKGLFDDTAQELAAANSEDETPMRGPAGPVRSMALTLGRMEEESRAMQEALLSGERVVELDPELIDMSFVRDRLAELPQDVADELVRSIEEDGQEVPILVRRHPQHDTRYQVVYGHRRLQALRLLGRKVQAIIRTLDDVDVVIAQGIENSARRNLSYIERAVFAFNLESKGFERPVIMKALSTDKTELSKLISVAKSIPMEAILTIGAAPAAGRRKWIALAQGWTSATTSRLRGLLGSEDFAAQASDRRFDLVVAELAKKPERQEATEYEWLPKRDGKIKGRIRSAGDSFTIALKTGDAADFGGYVARHLDELYEAFKAGK